MMLRSGSSRKSWAKPARGGKDFWSRIRRHLTKSHRERVPESDRREGALDGTEHRGSCNPSATQKSQPIPGFMPWKAPSPSSASHDQASLTDSRMSRMKSRRPPAGSDERGNRDRLDERENKLRRGYVTGIQPHAFLTKRLWRLVRIPG